MTVSTEGSRTSYAGSGTVGPFDLRTSGGEVIYFLNNADIRALKVERSTGNSTELVLTTDFTLTGAGDPDGGQLTLTSALSSVYDLIIFRDPAILQPADYTTNDKFPAETHETALDRITLIAQRLFGMIGRALRQPESDITDIATIPPKAQRANTFAYFDGDGNMQGAVSQPTNYTFTPTEQVFSGTGAQVDFVLATVPGTANALLVFVSGVKQKPASDYAVTGSTLTFTTAPAVGVNNIEVFGLGVAVPIGTATADATTFTPAGAGAVATTVSDKFYEVRSIQDFMTAAQKSDVRSGTGALNVTAAFQAAHDAGCIPFIPHGVYNVADPVTVTLDDWMLFGYGRKSKVLVNANGAAGTAIFRLFANGFMAKDFYVQSYSAAKRAQVFLIQPQSAALENFKFHHMNYKDSFYDVRADGSVTYGISDIEIIGGTAIAPTGVNCGHIMCDFVDGVRVMGHHVRGSLNSSAYGFADSTHITVVGCSEKGVEDSPSIWIEAAVELEDCHNAQATIVGNDFQHDIWVDDSNNVKVKGNSCRALRISHGSTDFVGDASGNMFGVEFEGNTAAHISIDTFAAFPPGTRANAKFKNNTLDPAGKGAQAGLFTAAIRLIGAYCANVELVGNEVLSNSSTNSVRLTRDTGATFEFYRNKLGTQAHNVSGTDGVILASNNKNELFTQASCQYVEVGLTANITAPTLVTWTKLPLNNETIDVNSEWNATNNNFTPKTEGIYEFSGIVTVDPDAIDSQMGYRLWRSSGTPAEIGRFALLRAVNGSIHEVPFRTIKVYLTPSDTVHIEYFVSGATTSILAGNTFTCIQIRKIME